MMEVILAFLMIFLIGCVSLVGVFMISMKEKTLDNILFILVAFATGTIIATALFDLIPEALRSLAEINAKKTVVNESFLFISIILGFVAFFIIERFIYWFHGHAHETDDKLVCYEKLLESDKIADLEKTKEGTVKPYVLLNLIGDGVHNALDGIVIMVAFLTGIPIGVIVTLAVFFHELPQEIGDFGILVYGGLTKRKALIFNFLSALVALLGGVIAYFLSGIIGSFNLFFLAFSGGGFLYIGCTELMPELINQKDLKKSVVQAIIFLGGIVVIIALILSLHV